MTVGEVTKTKKREIAKTDFLIGKKTKYREAVLKIIDKTLALQKTVPTLK